MKKNHATICKRTIQHGIRCYLAIEQYINDDFEKAVDCINISRAELCYSGIGKSAIIAQKIVATLNSTGSPAIFMHAADAIHGDLGMITAKRYCNYYQQKWRKC